MTLCSFTCIDCAASTELEIKPQEKIEGMTCPNCGSERFCVDLMQGDDTRSLIIALKEVYGRIQAIERFLANQSDEGYRLFAVEEQ